MTFPETKMMFEHYRQPLLSRFAFLKRMLLYVGWSLGLLVFTLGLGTYGFHAAEKYSLLDSFVNSVMIMTGLGMVNVLNTSAGKMFASFYALFSATIFFTILAILFAPLLHRFLHRFHLGIDGK